ncbi:MAG: putative multidrug ABC transporter permease YbhS [Phycisphaerae bacterium]|nr:putative multidrug ABC transporter permease YbhS [Phycisphaerae bacterium]
MKLRRVRAIAVKEFIQVIRDPRSLGMAIAMPMVLLMLFGYALTLDVDRVPMVVWDQSGTVRSREFIARFTGSRYFALHASVTDYRDMEYEIDSGRALVGLVVPRDFADRVQRGRSAPVQFIVDGSDSNTATIAIGYADSVAREYSLDVTIQRTLRNERNAATASPDAQAGGSVGQPLELRPRVWFNPELESRNFIIPGLIAVIMMVIAALLTSLTIAREWERGTMEQLISTPVKTTELILGKLAPYFAIGMLDVTVAVLMGQFLFAVPLRGSAALLFATSAVFMAGALSMGMLISIVTRSQLLASQFALVSSFLPAFLLSGFMFAIDNMPRPIQIVTYAIPTRYFVTLLKSIYLKGVGLELLWVEALLLVFFGAIMVLLANLKFRKKLM